jgi:hypothetical protein
LESAADSALRAGQSNGEDGPAPGVRPLGDFIAAATLLAGLSLLVGLIVPPTDELPHCDDWDYVETARHFVSTGRIVYSDWPTTTLLTHVLWGSGFVATFGDTYFVFRISMFVMSWIGACGVYQWCRLADWRWGPAVWVSTLFALNPLNITYEYSFMTDTTGVTASIWLGLLLSRAAVLRTGGSGIGVFSGVAYLARQIAIVPLLAYLALVGVRSLQKRKINYQAVVIVMAFAPFPIGYWLWMQISQGVPYASEWAARRGVPAFHELAERLTILLLGTALYLSPLSIGLWSGSRFRTSWKAIGVWFLVVVGVVTCCGRLPAPYERQEVFDMGVGFSDSIVERQHLAGPVVTLAGREWSLFRIVASALALLSLFATCQLFVAERRTWDSVSEDDDRRFVRRWLMPVSTAIMVGLLCIVPTMHGRYVWPVCVFVLIWLVSRFSHLGMAVPWAGVVLVGAIGGFGIVGIQDNSVSQQTIWAALRDLESQGIAPLQINGGLEFGGLRRFTPHYRGETHQGPYLGKLSSAERDRHIVLFNPMNIFAPAREYSVTYGPLDGNQIVREIPYRSWLRTGRIYVLRRNAPL